MAALMSSHLDIKPHVELAEKLVHAVAGHDVRSNRRHCGFDTLYRTVHNRLATPSGCKAAIQ